MTDDLSATLATHQDQAVITNAFCGNVSAETRSIGFGREISPTLNTCPDNATVMTNKHGIFCDDGRDHSRALIARMDGSPMIDKGPSIAIQGTLANENGYQNGSGIKDDGTMFTLAARDRHMVLTGAFTAGQGAKAGTCGFSDTTAPTLKADGGLSMMPSVVMERRNQ